MSNPADNDDTTDALFEEAAAWFLRLQTGETLETDPDFQAWLSASPAHADAMMRARIAWGAIGDNANSPEMVGFRRDALASGSSNAKARWEKKGVFSIPTSIVAVAACLAMVVGVSLLLELGPSENTEPVAVAETLDRYQTNIGETRTVTLADNSRLSLDASTSVEVRYSDEARDIALVAGQAHFEVAKDHVRPFRVTAGNQTVVATGTAFNVELVGEDVFVTLLEGEVVVTEGDGIETLRTPETEQSPSTVRNVSQSTILKPGQQLIASVEAPNVVDKAVNLEKTNAWRNGKVMLIDDPLTVAVARMNRYSQIRLVVVDDDLDALGVSGVFNAGDTDAFVEAIEAYFPIDARRMSSSRIELHPRG